jgi:ABC-type lipopolysaccharide export system ATPase subunit
MTPRPGVMVRVNGADDTNDPMYVRARKGIGWFW